MRVELKKTMEKLDRFSHADYWDKKPEIAAHEISIDVAKGLIRRYDDFLNKKNLHSAFNKLLALTGGGVEFIFQNDRVFLFIEVLNNGDVGFRLDFKQKSILYTQIFKVVLKKNCFGLKDSIDHILDGVFMSLHERVLVE